MNKRELGKYKSWLTSAGIALAIGLWLTTGQLPSDKPDTDATITEPSGQKTRSNVRTRTQTAESVTRMVVVNGNTAPARIVEINAETDGRVESTGIERGERLDKGEVIVRLDERDRQARLAQASATVKQRELEFEARKELKNQSYVSEAQLQEAAAMLEAARTELTRAELDVEYMTVRAPFDGILQDRLVEIGDYVKTGDPVAIFVDDHKIVISANISEFDADQVAIGNPGSARLAAGQIVEGLIRYVAPVADESTRTFRVELEVDNTEGTYRGGISAELIIPTETVYAHKISPSVLTLDDEGNLGIKTVDDAGRVTFHYADIAMSSSDGVWITGLPHSASIITVGHGFVNVGAYVDAIPEVEIDTAVAIKAGEGQ